MSTEYLRFCLPALVFASLIACSTEDVYDYDAAQEYLAQQKDLSYNNAFEEQFGEIASTQTWNTVEQLTLTVSVTTGLGQPVTVRAYSDNPAIDAAYSDAAMLGEFSTPDGAVTTVTLDVPPSTDVIYVGYLDAYDHLIFKTLYPSDGKVSSEFNFTGASARSGITVGGETVTYNITDDYKYFYQPMVDSFYTEFIKDKEKVSAADKFNNFEYISDGTPVIIYPACAGSKDADDIGFYCYDPASGTYVDKVSAETFFSNGDGWSNDGHTLKDSVWQMSASDGYTDMRTWQDDFSVYETITLRSKGTRLQVPAGYIFGMFLYSRTCKDTLYSNRLLNDNGQFYSQLSIHNQEDTPYHLIGLEDRDAKYYSDYDCNDFVLYLSPDPTPVIPTPVVDTQKYTIAFEDTGSIGDFDFNDVVLTMSHNPGSTETTVTLEAAGGTLETYITYKGERIFDGKEVHEIFGVSRKTMVNTGAGSTRDAVTCAITTPASFSMIEGQNAGDFGIEVIDDEGNTRTVSATTTAGAAPRALVIGDEWLWPLERTDIKEAYPDFEQYVNRPDLKTWYKNVTAGKVYTR